jgi:CRP/FNR family transcriptional regulator, cyclic AMP receptor protein
MRVSTPARLFDVRVFFASAGVRKENLHYRRGEEVFAQGDVSSSVMYIQSGGVKLSVRAKSGKEVVVAMLGPGEFLGEGCLAGQLRRTGSATAITQSAIVKVKKHEMMRLLHNQPGLAGRFITHMLGTNIRIEGDLLDQLFDHDERRLARTLLLLARYGGRGEPEPVLSRVSQVKLAEMSGTTRLKVGFFMKKLRRLGFIGAGRTLKINSSLLSVVLHD